MFQFEKALVWFRRDLRDFDHPALHHALRLSRRVYCTYVIDKDLFGARPQYDRRTEFILDCVLELDMALRSRGGGLIVRHGRAVEDLPLLAELLGVDAVFAHHDYEPQVERGDGIIARQLDAAGRRWLSFKDQVVFEKDEVLSKAGKPFSVFTPYKSAWLRLLHSLGEEDVLRSWPVEPYADRLAIPPEGLITTRPVLEDLGFVRTNLSEVGMPPGMSGGEALVDRFRSQIDDYAAMRDLPEADATSRLSPHLRFGTVSVRGLARLALDRLRQVGGSGAAAWLSELIWRDYYFMILHHHPHVVRQSFRPEYDAIEWERGDEAEQAFAAWREARTGYPLIDAAMTQLNESGYMHNRLRMVTASFLVKDLGIDWRQGEQYFAEQLVDFDLAANNGGWQWTASCGADAQPYFRIFNPVTQSRRFDPQGIFIKQYLPQLSRLPARLVHAPWLAPGPQLHEAGVDIGRSYPEPIVQHDDARRRTLLRYAAARESFRMRHPDDDAAEAGEE